MDTYLLTWNPKRWHSWSLQPDIETVRKRGRLRTRWSVGITKRIREGDRIFLMKLGEPPRGIMASGWVKSDVFTDRHWDIERRKQGKTALYVFVDFETLLDPRDIFPIELLEQGTLSDMHWTPQSSGVQIPPHVATELERFWGEFNNQPKPTTFTALPEEIEDETFKEGAVKQIMVNAYERNPEARLACLKKYGTVCMICEFDFKKVYGEIGAGYIHVHHLKGLSQIGKEYVLNAYRDLRPVCPNCHAMLHKRKPDAYTIAELKEIVRKQRHMGT